MDFALETGPAAKASHRIVLQRPHGTTRFVIQERGTLFGIIPFWWTLHRTYTRNEAEDWLQTNWKLPAYFHITRKAPA